jgi:hypothetical protein
MALTKDELIARQQIQIEEYKENMRTNGKILVSLVGKFYSIGAPLNDNCLKMNKEQLLWCQEVMNLIKEMECE